MGIGKDGKHYKIIVRHVKNVVFEAKPFFFLSYDTTFLLVNLVEMTSLKRMI